MSLFTKRKGRRISSFEDDDEPTTPAGTAPTGDEDSPELVVKPIRFGKRPLKQSALRRSINISDPDSLGTDPGDNPVRAQDAPPKAETATLDENDNGNGKDNDADEPAVVRPAALGRSTSRRRKNRLSTASSSSRLSFGGGGLFADGDNHGDDNDTRNAPAVVTPKREREAGASLTQRVLETNAFRKSLSSRLPTRQRPDDEDEDGEDDDDNRTTRPAVKSDYDDDDGRPRYSQAYLDELQNSTPNTPVNLAAMQKQQARRAGGTGARADAAETVDDAHLMDLDPAELDGAMLVDASELDTAVAVPDRPIDRTTGVGFVLPPPPAATVLTETEIQERKDRRARRAREGASVGGDDDEAAGYISVLTDEQKRRCAEKESTRLVRDDEDLGEGFDEFVEDRHAPRALGKKAERDARRRRKQEMADLITGDRLENKDDSDDSEAERRAAYDAAQTRAGMDGLRRFDGTENDADAGDAGDAVVHGGVHVPRMASALPDLADCLQQMQGALGALAAGVAQHRQRLADVDRDKGEIAAREAEVQGILDAAAAKYQAVLGRSSNNSSGEAAKEMRAPAFAAVHPLAAGASPLRAVPPGLAGEIRPVERGLESLGTTPTRRPQADDFF